jgi:hypothetical protein
LVLPLLAICGVASAGTLYQDPLFGVKTTSNLIYGTGRVNNGASSKNLTLDLYQPKKIGATAVPPTAHSESTQKFPRTKRSCNDLQAMAAR